VGQIIQTSATLLSRSMGAVDVLLKMNTRTKLFESMNWFKNGIETTPRNVITRTKIFESNLRIANNMSGSQAIKCVRTHIIAPRSRENLTNTKGVAREILLH